MLILIVFLLADYKLLKNFFQKERDRNISFTNSQYESYVKNNSDEKISKEFINEVLDDVIKSETISDNDVKDNSTIKYDDF